MHALKTSLLASLLLATATMEAQINIPVNAFGLVNTPYSADLTLGGQTRWGISIDPFTINANLVTTTPSNPAVVTAIGRTAIWFCLDPLQNIYNNTTKTLIYQTTDAAYFNKYNDPIIGGTAPANGGGLNQTEIEAIKTLFTNNYVAASANTATGLLTAAALQLAIWEVANENNGSTTPTDYNLATGVFAASNIKKNGSSDNTGLFALATNMLGILNTIENTPANAPAFTGSLDFLIDGKQKKSDNSAYVQVQDLVGWDPPTAPIPESSSFAAGALALLGVVAFRKFGRGKSKAPAVSVA